MDIAEPAGLRTLELFRQLYELAHSYRPPLAERSQDWLMNQASRDPVFKERLLRFIDVLAALDFDAGGGRVKDLFRQYFAGPFRRSSPGLRLLLALYRQPFVPARLLARDSRRAMRALAGRFIAASGHQAILNVAAYLERQGRRATFDLLGEEVLSEHEAEQFKTRYLNLIDELTVRYASGGNRSTPQLSIKLTSLTDNFNPADPEGTAGRVRQRLETIVDRCVAGGVGLNVDAELYEHREATWFIFSTMFGPDSPFGRWRGAGLTIQSYFKDSEEFLQTVLDFARKRPAPLQVRLAKGAYWDYEVITARQNHWSVPVFEKKSETDGTFRKMLATLLRNGDHIDLAVAGHNIADHARAEALRESLGLAEGVVEHQTLFRTAEGVSRAIRRMGWTARDYVPSGELVPGMAYLVRRVLENTSTQGFLKRFRYGESLSDLLKPAGKVESAPEEVGEVFRNHPPKRLFVAGERLAFQTKLKESLTLWGQEYPVKVGDKELKTAEIKTSLSPSLPDPERPVGRVHMAGRNETQLAINTARQGFLRWSTTPAQERAGLLLKVAERLAQERDGLAAMVVHEGGRIWAEALADVDEAVDHFAYNAHRLLACGYELEERYLPRGVVAVISPWNFPAALPSGMISGALAAGNAVILKSAEQTPVIASLLVDIVHSAGVPVDVLQHLAGSGEIVGDYLVRSNETDMVAFTGSKAVGLGIYKKTSAMRPASGLKKVVAEMGGKNAIIVFPDADLDEAAKGILLSAFEHANQKCSACSRVFAHRSIFGKLSQRLAHASESIPVGPADDPGTLVNPLIEYEARERVLAYAEKARSEGRVLVDRTSVASSNPLQVGPLIVELEPAMVSKSALAQEEIFGPVLALVPFDDEKEMLAQVNGTAYALTAGVFSRNPSTVARIIGGIRAGNIYVNRKITGARVGIEPFGGFQLSGTGPKAGGADYLFAFVRRKREPDSSITAPSNMAGMIPSTPAIAIEPWSFGVHHRREVLKRCLRLLSGDYRGNLLRALTGIEASPEEMAARLLTVASAVVKSSWEIEEAEATITIPGQKNFIDWRTPRGKGFVATSTNTTADLFGGMIFGPLLAGNGLVLAPAANLQPAAGVLVNALYQAGVPHKALALEPHGGHETAVPLAEDMFHFAVTDLGLDDTLRVYERLGETREDKGQRWVKALISMQDDRRPGEVGFIRQFALPKTVSIRTLRHGADLEIPLPGHLY